MAALTRSSAVRARGSAGATGELRDTWNSSQFGQLSQLSVDVLKEPGPDIVDLCGQLAPLLPWPFGDGVGAVVAKAKGMWRPRAHCGDVGAQQSNTRPGCLSPDLLTPCRPQSSLVRSSATCWTYSAA